MVLVLGLLAFVIEFAFMVGVYQVASRVVGGGVGGLLVGVLAVVLVAALWGVFIAPRARRRLPKVTRAAVSGGAVALVGGGLLALDHTRFGLVLIGGGIVLVAAQLALDENVPVRPKAPPGDTRRERQRGRRRR